MQFLRRNTSVTRQAGPIISKTDGATPLTTVTAPSTSNVAITKNGVMSAYTLVGWAHNRQGKYDMTIGTGDVGAAGELKYTFTDASQFIEFEEVYCVLPEAIYDFLFGTVAPALSSDVTAILAAITAVSAKLPPLGLAGTVTDTSPAAGSFKISNIAAPTTSLVATPPKTLVFTSGSLASYYAAITGDTGPGATRTLSFSNPFPAAPGNGDSFYILH